jgi:hypothetical protein
MNAILDEVKCQLLNEKQGFMVKVRIGNDVWLKHVAGAILIQVKTRDEINILWDTLGSWRDTDIWEKGNNWIRVQYRPFFQCPSRDEDEFFK